MEGTKKEIINRLNRIEGQIKGLQRMIEEEEECKAVLTQFSAVKSALESAACVVLQNYAKECIDDSIEKSTNENIDDLIEVMKKFIKR
ncbi:MAG: metal-sensitive transcriptional regulator [Eubacteriaceae bacterium]